MFDQQLTFDGGAKDIAPATKQDRLFTAPKSIKGQTAMATDAALKTWRLLATSHRAGGGQRDIVVQAKSGDDAYQQAYEREPDWFGSTEFSRQQLVTVQIACLTDEHNESLAAYSANYKG